MYAPMAKITPETMREFEGWMKAREVGEGSRKLYSQQIKTMLARASADGVIAINGLAAYPLGHLSNRATHKRSISEHDIALIEGAKVEKRLEFWRDLFLLSYYLRGMNLADLADLTSEQISAGRMWVDGELMGMREVTKGGVSQTEVDVLLAADVSALMSST